MLAKKDIQGRLFETKLTDIVEEKHELCILSGHIDWDALNDKFKVVYCENFGRPGKEIRLMISLQYLKYTFNVSDEVLVKMWVENPYWQYFSGEEYFQHSFPINPSLMTKFRNRVKSNNIEHLLSETIKSGLTLKVINKKSLENVTVDTTVQEKNITFPTDAKLY